MTDAETVAPSRDERLLKGLVVPDAGRRQTRAARRRRQGRREEWTQHVKLARMLAAYLDNRCTWWSSLENKPRSFASGRAQRLRGCKSGLPDCLVIAAGRPIFIELKSRAGVASKTQKQARAAMLPAGAVWYMARSARAAMTALYRSGVAFRRQWVPPQLKPWEGPFDDPHQRLPQHPEIKLYRRAAQKRYRQRLRARKAAQPAPVPLSIGA